MGCVSLLQRSDAAGILGSANVQQEKSIGEKIIRGKSEIQGFDSIESLRVIIVQESALWGNDFG